jgi:hypothetical protein
LSSLPKWLLREKHGPTGWDLRPSSAWTNRRPWVWCLSLRKSRYPRGDYSINLMTLMTTFPLFHPFLYIPATVAQYIPWLYGDSSDCGSWFVLSCASSTSWWGGASVHPTTCVWGGN